MYSLVTEICTLVNNTGLSFSIQGPHHIQRSTCGTMVAKVYGDMFNQVTEKDRHWEASSITDKIVDYFQLSGHCVGHAVAEQYKCGYHCKLSQDNFDQEYVSVWMLLF